MNAIGIATLTNREIGRFMKVYMQTLLSPLVTTILFFAIFSLARVDTGDASASAAHTMLGVPFMEFLGPGLVMMSMAQNAFANTSSSIIIAKVQGNIVDTLMAPLGPWELIAGYLAGGVARGLLVGAVSFFALSFFMPLSIAQPWAILAFGVLGCLMMATMGLLTGLWADKFDHLAAITNFIVTPLTFLSGTFYEVERLPEEFQTIAHFNPFFLMIDGFRYGFIGTSDAPVMASLLGCLACAAVAVFFTWRLLSLGYKIKS